MNNLKLSLNNNNDDGNDDGNDDDDDDDDRDDDDDVIVSLASDKPLILLENTDRRLFRATTSPSTRRILSYFKHSLFSASMSDV